MSILIVLPAPGEASPELSRASGEPLPVFSTVPGQAPPVLPQRHPAVIRELRPAPAKTEANWSSSPEDDARIEAISRSVTMGALEVLAGTRPLQQLVRWMDFEEFERLQLRTNLVRGREGARLHRNVRILRVRVCPVAPGVYETAVAAAETDRVRAVALRLELRRGLWKVAALEIG
ncbi:Rv3235 family protein [Arthrobacter luteolus]|uniref:Rv3235 family protein n=1 Tax=Arthrobacter luteolus TaxID=98672 RepID=UPI0038507255